MEIEVYRKDGTASGEKVTLAAAIFEVEPNKHVLYQAVRVHMANQRQGTHKVKTMGEVAGSGKKLWKQKHTGRARVGSVRSPLWKGGGSIFGPKPRDYSVKLPKSMKEVARKSALSAKAVEGGIKVVEDFTFDAPKTKDLATVIKALGLNEKKVLMLTPATNLHLYKSGRNIDRFKMMEANKVSTYDLLDSEVLLMQKSAVAVLEKSFEEKA
jgi:large subunit ribosomal protein L4